MSEDAVPDIETIAVPFYVRLISPLQELVVAQRADLRLLDFVDDRQSEFDDRRAAALASLSGRYPMLSGEQLEKLVDGMIVIERELAREGEDDQRAHIEELIRELTDPVKDDYVAHVVLNDVVRASRERPSTPRMRASIFTGLVASFEVFISSLISELAHEYPGRVLHEDREVKWKEIAASESIEALRAALVTDSTDALMRKSFDKWIEHLETKFHVRIPAISLELHETILRRHAFMHAGGRASAEYIRRLKEVGAAKTPDLGQDLAVDSTYVRAAADMLLHVAFTLTANAAVKYASSDRRNAELRLVNVPYRLMQDGRLDACRFICEEYKSASFSERATKNIMLVNYWLSMRMLGRESEVRREVENWDVSAESPRFRLARHALLGELAEGLKLAQRIRGTEDLPQHHWLTWPLLDDIRKLEKMEIEERALAALVVEEAEDLAAAARDGEPDPAAAPADFAVREVNESSDGGVREPQPVEDESAAADTQESHPTGSSGDPA